MIYADHAATGYPKSLEVCKDISGAITCYGANPGRGAYPMAMASSEKVYACRQTAAMIFGLSDARRVIFTPGCTQSLNTVIRSLLSGGGRAVVSDLEHNAVMRPLYSLSPSYPLFDVAHVIPGDDDATVAAFRRMITPKTRALICTHASNVTGTVLPVKRLASLAHEHDIPIVVDAAQSAGHLPINMEEDQLDYVCVAGHKGLGGPMGIGMLMCLKDTPLTPLVYGGTGSYSADLKQPDDLPERLESGTPNVVGICGLHAGLKQLKRYGIERIMRYEHWLSLRFYEECCRIPHVLLFSPMPLQGKSTPVISLCVDGLSVEDTAAGLARCGIAVRAGLHCAPQAHKSIGTFPQGTVRFSFGKTNDIKEIEKCVWILKKIAANPLQFEAIV